MIYLYGASDSPTLTRLARQVFGMTGWQRADLADAPLSPMEGVVIIACGGEAFAQYQQYLVYPKGRALGSMREKPQKVGGGWVLCTYSAGMVFSDAEAEQKILWDFRLAKRLHDTGTTRPTVGDYRWLNTVEEWEAKVDEIIARAEEQGGLAVALDLETMGLFPWYPEKDVVTCQITDRPGAGWVLHMKDVASQAHRVRYRVALQKLLSHPKVKIRGANLKFDLQWLKEKDGIVCTNFRFDTLLGGSILNENRRNGLKGHAREYTDLGAYEEAFEARYDKSRMETVPKEAPEYLVYTGGDVDACLQVSERLIDELAQDGALMKFYTTILHPAARAFENIEARGVHVDLDKFHELHVALKTEHDTSHDAALRAMSVNPRLKAKYLTDYTLSRPVIVRDYMFTDLGLNLKPLEYTAGGKTSKTPQISTSVKHFRRFMDVPAAATFLEPYFRWASAAKMIGTYVEGFLEHLRPDGKFHPNYMLFNGEMFDGEDEDTGGTLTGRLSCKNPAMQTLPKHAKKGHQNWPKMMRKCFPAPEGYWFWEADYSQGELRVTADVANERNMLNAYLNGMDLHCLTGSQMLEMDYASFEEVYQAGEAAKGGQKIDVDPELLRRVQTARQQAKPANFGLLYGMGAPGFRIFARDSYGVNLTEEEAVQRREAFFRAYPGLLDWHDEYRKLARSNLFVRSPLGRIRHLPLIRSPDGEVRSYAERQAINSPIQSCLSDMCLWAIALIEERFGPTGDVLIAGMTHDAIYGYARKDRWHELAPQITGTMANLPLDQLGWKPKLNFPADLKFGPSWGELDTYKAPALAAAA